MGWVGLFVFIVIVIWVPGLGLIDSDDYERSHGESQVLQRTCDTAIILVQHGQFELAVSMVLAIRAERLQELESAFLWTNPDEPIPKDMLPVDCANTLGIAYSQLGRDFDAMREFMNEIQSHGPHSDQARHNLLQLRRVFGSDEMGWMIGLLTDRHRNEMMLEVLLRAIDRNEVLGGARVLEYGVGTALWAIAAHRAGAKSYVAGYDSIAHVLSTGVLDSNGLSREIPALPQLDASTPANILVWDLWRPGLLHLPKLLSNLHSIHASVLLADEISRSHGATFLPAGISLYVTAVESPSLRARRHVDIESIGLHVTPRMGFVGPLARPREVLRPLSRPSLLHSVWIHNPQTLEVELTRRQIDAIASGQLDGFIVWPRIHLDETTFLDGSPFATSKDWPFHWSTPLAFTCSGHAVVQHGEPISFDFSLSPSKGLHLLSNCISSQFDTQSLASAHRLNMYAEATKRSMLGRTQPPALVLTCGYGATAASTAALRYSAAKVYQASLKEDPSGLWEVDKGLLSYLNSAGAPSYLSKTLEKVEVVEGYTPPTVQEMNSGNYSLKRGVLPAKADVFVYAAEDAALFRTAYLEAHCHALQNLLAPEATIIPAAAILHVMPIESLSLRRMFHVAPDVSLFRHEDSPPCTESSKHSACRGSLSAPINFTVLDYGFSRFDPLEVDVSQLGFDALGMPVPFHSVDLTQCVQEQREVRFTMEVTRSGIVDGFIFWHELYLDERGSISNGPETSGSGVGAMPQAVFPLSYGSRKKFVSRGGYLDVVVSFGPFGLDVRWAENP